MCVTKGLSPYRTVNTLCFGYKTNMLLIYKTKLLFVLRSIQNT